MGSEENDGRAFQNRNSSDFPSSGMASNSVLCSESMFKTANGVDPFYGSGWYPIASLSRSGNFGSSSQNPLYSVLMDNQTMRSGSSSHFPSDSCPGDVAEIIQCFGGGSFLEMVGSFSHVPDSGYNSDCTQKNGMVMQNVQNGVLENSPNGKRKREASFGGSPKESEEKKETEDDETKQKWGPSVGVDSRSKQAIHDFWIRIRPDASAGHSKESYIHVRAKRGQATNSHSLAERVRRERISERMRLLQELLPGCNKITGKAVMLDDIISYVQSLQQQVEFLSIKLATVNPELSVDIERILSIDILQLQGSCTTRFVISPGLGLPHPFPGYSHGNFSDRPGTNLLTKKRNDSRFSDFNHVNVTVRIATLEY